MGSTAFGDKIKALRAERGWTQEELARRSGVKRGYVASVESGQVANPSAAVFSKLAAAFRVSLDELCEAAGYFSSATWLRRPVETPEDAIDHLRLVQPVSVPLYRWEDYPFISGQHPVATDYIYRAKHRAVGREMEAYKVRGSHWEPMIMHNDVIVVDRKESIDEGELVVCRHRGQPVIGTLKKVGGNPYLETNRGLIEFLDCQAPAQIIEIRRWLDAEDISSC